MDRHYGLSDKGTIRVINFLKQRITVGAKTRWYNQWNIQYHQNNMFRNDQRKISMERLMGRLWHQTQRDQLSFAASYGLNQWSTIEITSGWRRWKKQKLESTCLRPKFKQHLQECVNAGAVPTWMTERKRNFRTYTGKLER